MDKNLCRFSEGTIALPQGYCERTINTFADIHAKQPPITLSRDRLGNHNSVEEYIASQLSILQKQMKEWVQAPYKEAILGNGLVSGIMLTYNFLRPDNIRMFQKQAVFTLDMEHLLIFSLSRASALTQADTQRFTALLHSFQLNA